MDCEVCNKQEVKYQYNALDNERILICANCGKIIYGMKPIYHDRRMELIRMKECVLFYKQMIEDRNENVKIYKIKR